MTQAPCLYSESLPECADSIESHPFLPGLFALATYQVDQQEVDRELRSAKTETDKGDEHQDEDEAETQASSPPYTRSGLLRLYQARSFSGEAVSCEILEEKQMAAILDTKWSLVDIPGTSPSGGLLGVADATGNVSLFTLDPDCQLKQRNTFTLNSNKALCLSLDWSDRIMHYPSSEAGNADAKRADDASLIVSQSDGSLALMPSIDAAMSGDPARLKARASAEDEDEESDDSCEDEEEAGQSSATSASWDHKPIGLETWHAHDHEAWIAAFDCFSRGQVAWSGGDDLAMKGWDLRTPIRRGRRSPIFTNRRDFEGGVTTMQSHWSKEGLWAVGSYDGKLRLFDSRSTIRPLATLELPGGIWRLKWHPQDPARLLAGCMHGGFVVVEVPFAAERAGSVSQDVEIVSTFDGHQSLAYGCDWDRGDLSREQSTENTMIYSCSFYDKKLCAWRG